MVCDPHPHVHTLLDPRRGCLTLKPLIVAVQFGEAKGIYRKPFCFSKIL